MQATADAYGRRGCRSALLLALVLLVSLAGVGAPASASSDPGALERSCPDPLPASGFSDVPRGGTHARAIGCLSAWGITHGVEPTRYAPARTVTRGQMASLLARLLRTSGSPLPAPATPRFSDVSGTHADHIEALALAGVTRGTTATTFAPHDAITRAQAASLIVRSLRVLGVRLPAGEPRFGDVVAGAHARAIGQLQRARIVQGTGDSRYVPQGRVTRAQMASLLMRTADLLVLEGVVEVPYGTGRPPPPVPDPATATLAGTVSDDHGDPVDGSAVTVYRDGEPVAAGTTDAQGAFSLVTPADGGLISVVASPPGEPLRVADLTGRHALGSATDVLRPWPGGTYDLPMVLWSERPLLDPNVPGESLFDGATLTTPDGSVTISGIPDDLSVVGGSARAFSPTVVPQAFPGEFATRQDGVASGLFSAGFVSVNLLEQDDDGHVAPVSELRDAHGDPVRVELRFRIDPADWHVIQDGEHHRDLPGYVDRPDRIDAPLYAFDERAGDWVLADEFGWLEDVDGPLPPSALPDLRDGSHPHEVYMVGLVDHFSKYNLDYPTRDACLGGRLVDDKGTVLAHERMTFTAAPGSAPFSNRIEVTTDAQGRFEVQLPRSEKDADDDWNDNGEVDTYKVVAEVVVGDGIFLFGGAEGIRTPTEPAVGGCQVEDLVVDEKDEKKAKRVEFELTFRESGSAAPLFVTPPSVAFPNYAQATLFDLAVPVGGELWKEACGVPCSPQSTTDANGVARLAIPVLQRDLPHLEHLSGSFSYHKMRPDLGLGAWEFANAAYAVATNRKKETLSVPVERRGPPTVTVVEPQPAASYLFDDEVPLEATGVDLSGNSFDHLPYNFLWWSPTARTTTLAVERTASVPAGGAFGSGTHELTVQGIDTGGWLGTATVDSVTVATVGVAVSPGGLDLTQGDEATLTAAVTGATDQSVTWTSSDLGVASVDSGGEVTAIGAGTATITARSTVDPTRTAAATVGVEALEAAFTVTPGSGDTTTAFTLHAGASVGDITSYAWDLGDGTIGSGITATHTYGLAGSYVAELTVTSTSGATARTTRAIEVVEAGGNLPPTAAFTAAPLIGNPGAITSFDASTSSDPDGDVVAWEWDLGDGTLASGQSIDHVYTVSGSYTVVLTVTDDDGATASATEQIHVNHPPIAAFSVSPGAGVAPLEVTVNASGASDLDGQIQRFAWDFGDGTTVEDGGVLETHVYTEPGTYDVVLTVEDDGGLTDSTDRTVTVEAAATFAATLLTDEPRVTYAFDAQELAQPGATYRWIFGDGDEVVTTTHATNHRYTSPGDYTVSLRVQDVDGQVVLASTTVTVVDPDIGDVVAVAAGERFSVVLMADGTVWTWGTNAEGQLGDGTREFRSLPARVSGLEDVVAISTARLHTLALTADGGVWAWGHNGSGQLGDPTPIRSTVPVRAQGLDGVVAIAAGEHHSLAVTDDGAVWAWGANGSGQLGDGTTLGPSRSVPGQVGGVEGFVSVAAGHDFSLALDEDGAVWAWGQNFSGQLGSGELYGFPRPVPGRVVDLDGVVAITAGAGHAAALDGDGAVWSWGQNGSATLGDGTSGGNRAVPGLVPGLSGIDRIAAGRFHTFAIAEDGAVWGWGQNGGRLGDGSFDTRPAPVKVHGLAGPVDVAGGSNHSLGADADGIAWIWPANHDHLGTPDHLVPRRVPWW
jgi:alpha-tubulin suppressor-like RCC1 family protein/chitodextrinase